MKDKGRAGLRLLERLKAYRALDHPIRLKAYITIHDERDLPFNKLTKKLRTSSGLAAYHIGVLRAAGLVDVEYVRRSKDTSQYRLSEKGEEVYRDALGRSESKVIARKSKD